MGTQCLICKRNFTITDTITKLVNGRIKTNNFGGDQFIEEEAFPVQGYVHFTCLLNQLKSQKEIETKIATFI